MKKTLGMMIAELRKEKGMTQLELAERMGVTDKAVSKWERDLSCPDINSLPNLAEILGVTVDDLMQIKKDAENPSQSVQDIIQLIFKVVPLAMGVAVVVLSVMGELEIQSGFTMLGIGLFCIGISLLNNKN
ncbi:MAG: helix-turn-helix transcriptional regulator [Alphaproteobacteria bacterium]|nr:helix-turn-helix transcriptional regulator [Alphaproteobacteria bacterium]